MDTKPNEFSPPQQRRSQGSGQAISSRRNDVGLFNHLIPLMTRRYYPDIYETKYDINCRLVYIVRIHRNHYQSVNQEPAGGCKPELTCALDYSTCVRNVHLRLPDFLVAITPI